LPLLPFTVFWAAIQYFFYSYAAVDVTVGVDYSQFSVIVDRTSPGKLVAAP
jgi:hypothetical protein